MGFGAEAGIPADADLTVSELTGPEGEDYVARAAEALDADTVAYAKALDIAIEQDGVRLQPAAPVTVSIRLLDAPDNINEENLSVLHFGEEVEAVDCTLNGDAGLRTAVTLPSSSAVT